jgi:ketosteroid isomerase-like protein
MLTPFDKPSLSETIVRAFYACCSRCDFTGLLDLFSADVEITQAEGLPGGRRFIGYEGVANFLLAYRWNLRSEFGPRILSASGAEWVVIGRLRGRNWSDHRAVSHDFVHVWTISSGQIVRLRVLTEVAAVAGPLGITAPQSAPQI